MNKFTVGDKVWYAKCKYEPINLLCPTCFGKKEVTLILGNGDSVILECSGCTVGMVSPTGYIQEYNYVVQPELIRITNIRVEISEGKEIVEYYSDNYSLDESDIFWTEDEARARAEEKKETLDKDQRTRAEYLKKNARKSFSWNAHYHMREAKNSRKKVLYHEEKAKLCKEQIKDTGGLK